MSDVLYGQSIYMYTVMLYSIHFASGVYSLKYFFLCVGGSRTSLLWTLLGQVLIIGLILEVDLYIKVHYWDLRNCPG